MDKTPASEQADDTLPPQPVQRAKIRRPRFSLIWLLPLVAIVVALSLAVHQWRQKGPTITIRFQTADGLVVGKTQVRYKEVEIGTVRQINLAPDGNGVLVRAQLVGSAAHVANSSTRFWVVRPRLGGGGISGLSTLMSGAYIGVDTVDAKSERTTEFVGLEKPPALVSTSKGTRFNLVSDSLGSLQVGSPLYFRRMEVGRVTDFELSPDGKQVRIEAFVDQPYDAFVHKDSRFWNASGFDMVLGADGLRIDTQSLTSLMGGGIAFGDTPHGDKVEGEAERAPAESSFHLYGTQQAAYSTHQGNPVTVRMRYNQSIRGLADNAPVEFGGKPIGEVKRTQLAFDTQRKQFYALVDADIYPRQNPQAFQGLMQQLGGQQWAAQEQDRAFVRYLAQNGYRATMKSGNMLTGQMLISLEHMPKVAALGADLHSNPIVFPSAQGAGIDQLQTQLSNIASNLEKVDFGKISTDLQATLRSANQALTTANAAMKDLSPEVRKVLGDAQKAISAADATMQSLNGPGGMVDQTGSAMDELRKAARSLRGASDYLTQHPNALLRGRAVSPTPAAVTPASE